MTISNVILVGANGKLGPSILGALQSASFNVSVLSRKSSKSTYPSDVRVIQTSDDPSVDELIPLLRHQDAVVVIFAGSISTLQIRLADAAAQAGVQRFIPADFGSCDSSSEQALRLIPLYSTKRKVREHLQVLALRGELSWTSLVCGHFFDFGLRSGLLQLKIRERKAMLFDGGDIRWSATTIGTIAKAVVGILENLDLTKNRMLYIQSFCVSQNDVLKSLKKVTQDDWQVQNVDSTVYIKEIKAELDKNPNDSEANENLVSVVGIIDANWEKKEDFANELLGVGGEDLDQVVEQIVAEQRRS